MTVTNDHISKKIRVLKASASETYNTYKTACDKTRQRILKTLENDVYKPGQVAGRTLSTKSFTPNIISPEFFKEIGSSNKRASEYASVTIQLPPKMPDNNNVRGIFYFFTSKNYYKNLQVPV